jgi:hypothetical protein
MHEANYAAFDRSVPASLGTTSLLLLLLLLLASSGLTPAGGYRLVDCSCHSWDGVVVPLAGGRKVGQRVGARGGALARQPRGTALAR